MKIKRPVSAVLIAIVAVSAWAQSAPQPLNLKLPPEAVSAESATPGPAVDGNAAVDAMDAKGAPIPAGDSDQMPSGMPQDNRDDKPLNPNATVLPRKCDDSTYNQPQIHGDMSVGVVGGNHVSGNYQAGRLNVSQAFGSCDKPTGGINISIGVSQGNFNGRRQGGH